jgi:quercetin dioxygenase-like cupin family protein
MAKEDKAIRSVVKNRDAVPLEKVEAATATRRQVLLGPQDGVTNFFMRRFVMEAGGGMPRHTNTVEHEQYVLRGRAVIGVGEREHEVSAGDVLYIPAHTPHHYRVIEAPFEFLCLVPNAPDRMERVGDDRPGGAA